MGDVFVLDVLPTPIPFLISGHNGGAKCVVYYCHFPDKLLTRDTVNGVPLILSNGSDGHSFIRKNLKYFLQRPYRLLMDSIEEWTMSFADLTCVNSKFTMEEVINAFPSLQRKNQRNHRHVDGVHVLYPPLDLKKFVPPIFARKEENIKSNSCPIVSLNRFERKKNIQLLLNSYAMLLNQVPILPPLVISGGYDPKNIENVQYLQELRNLAQELKIESYTTFRPNISDD